VGVGKERGGVLAVGAREGQQGVRARVPAAGKVLEGDDQRTLSPLYYDGALQVLFTYLLTLLSVCLNDCFRRIFAFKCFEFVKCLQFHCNESPFVYIFDLYKWKFLTPVSNVHNRFVALYNINRRVINSFNSNYGADKSHEQMKRVVCEHFFISLFQLTDFNADMLMGVAYVCVFKCFFLIF